MYESGKRTSALFKSSFARTWGVSSTGAAGMVGLNANFGVVAPNMLRGLQPVFAIFCILGDSGDLKAFEKIDGCIKGSNRRYPPFMLLYKCCYEAGYYVYCEGRISAGSVNVRILFGSSAVATSTCSSLLVRLQ